MAWINIIWGKWNHIYINALAGSFFDRIIIAINKIDKPTVGYSYYIYQDDLVRSGECIMLHNPSSGNFWEWGQELGTAPKIAEFRPLRLALSHSP